MSLHPIQQAIIDLRDSGVSTREKQLEFHLAFGTFLLAWLDCAPPDAVKASMQYGVHACDQHGVCTCGHAMSEGHLRHGTSFTPPAPTALAQSWTEQDQSEAYAEGWLLLVDRKGRPFIAAVPGGDVDSADGMAEALVRLEAEEGCPLSRKAVELLDRETTEEANT